jgi:hypothetical protein
MQRDPQFLLDMLQSADFVGCVPCYNEGERTLYHFSLFVADILIPSTFLGEGLELRKINYLCYTFEKWYHPREDSFFLSLHRRDQRP